MGHSEVRSRFRLPLDCQRRREMMARVVTRIRTFQVPRLKTKPGKPEASWSAMWGVRAEISSSSAANKPAKPAIRHSGCGSVAGRQTEPVETESDSIEDMRYPASPIRGKPG